MVESVRLLESASLEICDLADRIEKYLPKAEATLTLSLRSRGQDPAAAAAGAAADRMLVGLRHLAVASRTYSVTLDDPDVDDSAAETVGPLAEGPRNVGLLSTPSPTSSR